MLGRTLRVAALVGAGIAVCTAATAANVPQSPAKLLFETKHIEDISPGTELVYTFARKPSDEAVLGKGYTDTIRVKIDSEGKEKGKKNVTLNIYTGERKRDPHQITDMDGNPMLVVYLDNAVAHFRDLAGGDRAYLKNTFSRKIGDAAKLDPVKIDYNGSEVEGYRVTIAPYIADPARSKMRGFEGSTFSIVVSDKIPGFFAKMTSNYANNEKDSPSLLETTTLEGVGEVK